MATSVDAPISAKKEKTPKRQGRRSRQSAPENLRFFVGKPCRNHEAPQLEREVASEAEGLVAAFKTDGSLFLLSEYTVMQRIESGRVTLGKEPAAAATQRVSTVNAS
jgi:hypothetical protein